MTKPTGSGFLRSHIRAANPPLSRVELALQKRANSVIDAMVVVDADRARRLLDAQKGRG